MFPYAVKLILQFFIFYFYVIWDSFHSCWVFLCSKNLLHHWRPCWQGVQAASFFWWMRSPASLHCSCAWLETLMMISRSCERLLLLHRVQINIVLNSQSTQMGVLSWCCVGYLYEIFRSALASFKLRACYANVSYDRILLIWMLRRWLIWTEHTCYRDQNSWNTCDFLYLPKCP